ncbi:MAG: hypothetical protein AAFR38_03850 [Planctomycetota bacterium]
MPSDAQTILTVCMIAAGVLAVMHLFASRIRNETLIHDLKIEVANLRNEYTRQLRILYGEDQEGGDIEIIDESGAPPEALPMADSQDQGASGEPAAAEAA